MKRYEKLVASVLSVAMIFQMGSTTAFAMGDPSKKIPKTISGEAAPGQTGTALSEALKIEGITVLGKSGQISSSESAEKLFDSDNHGTKWCVNGNTGYVVFDIQKPMLVTKMIGYHCKQSSSAWDKEHEGNTKAYALQVFNGEGMPTEADYSIDERWTTVGAETENMDAVKSTAVSMSAPARYFRLRVTDAGGNNSAVRFYGLELYGKEKEITEPVTVSFDKGGGQGTQKNLTLQKGDSFTLPQCTFTPPSGKVFAGWLVDGRAPAKQAGETISVTKDTCLLATWKVQTSGPKRPAVPADERYFQIDENGVITGTNDKIDGHDTRLPERLLVPSQIGGKTVTGIGNQGLTDYYGNVKTVWLPNTVKTLCEESFCNMCDSLLYVDIGDGVETLGQQVFNWNQSLETVRFGKSLSSFLPGDSVFNTFSACQNLQNIEVDAENTTYQSKNGVVYSKDGKTLVMVPRGRSGELTVAEGTTTVGNGSFNRSNLTTVKLPASVTSIADYVFNSCQMLQEIQFAGTKAQWAAVIKGEEAIPSAILIKTSEGYMPADVTKKGLDFSKDTPAEETTFLAGKGTITFTPAQNGGIPTVTLENATLMSGDRRNTAQLLFTSPNDMEGTAGIPKVNLVLKGQNTVDGIIANNLEIGGSGTLCVRNELDITGALTGTTAGLNALVNEFKISQTPTMSMKAKYTVYGNYELQDKMEMPIGKYLIGDGSVNVDISFSVPKGSAFTIPTQNNSRYNLSILDAASLHNAGTLRNEAEGGIELYVEENTTDEAIKAAILSMNLTGSGTVEVYKRDFFNNDASTEPIVYSNTGMPVKVVDTELNFTLESTPTGVLDTDGYHWDQATNTLTLKNVNISDNIILPDSAAIQTVGESKIETVKGARTLTFDGSAPLTWLRISYDDIKVVHIKEGAYLNIEGGQPLYGNKVTVSGVLNSQTEISAFEQATITSTGFVGCTGSGCLITRNFTMEDGARFEGNCTTLTLGVAGKPGDSEEQVKKAIHLPEGYLGNQYEIKTAVPNSGVTWAFIVEKGKTPSLDENNRFQNAGGILVLPCKTFSITFYDTNETVSTTEESKLTALPTATKENYTFEGWFTAAEGGEPITADTVFKQNTTVYAHWKQNHVHNWGKPVFTFSQDGKTATAVVICEHDKSHTKEVKDVDVTSEITTAATCTEKGTTTYTAKVTYGEQVYTDTTTRQDVEINPDNHNNQIVKIEGKVPTNSTDGWKDYCKCSACGKFFEDENCTREIADVDVWKSGDGRIEKIGYAVIEGNNGSWQKNTDGTITFRVNGDFAEFTGIKIDGASVASKHYIAKSGSTIVTLKKDYLQSLSEGSHTITFLYTDGQCEANFTVTAAAAPTEPTAPEPTNPVNPNPPTGVGSSQIGDESHMMLWLIISIASTFGLVGTILYRRKRNTVR